MTEEESEDITRTLSHSVLAMVKDQPVDAAISAFGGVLFAVLLAYPRGNPGKAHRAHSVGMERNCEAV